MDFCDAMKTSASGLSAQRVRMSLISSNLANAATTRTAEGGPYKRKDAVFESRPLSFNDVMQQELDGSLSRVGVSAIVDDQRPALTKFDPGHPDADVNGYVSLPNVNLMEEMVNMISATRSYEANVTAIKSAKEMALKALEIGA
jgi:flagellar basal-body rod protein FlgC